jgi:transposase-like protein
MSQEQPRRKPTARRYSPEEKAQAVRLVRQLRAELGTDHGTVKRVAGQLGYGTESVRNWVHQADIDEGRVGGTTTAEAERIKKLEQENKELKRTNEILRRASAYFAQAELDRPWK